MKRKLNTPILGLFTTLEEIFSTAHNKIVQWGFTAKKYPDRLRQTPADSAKKARRRMIQASQRRNRI